MSFFISSVSRPDSRRGILREVLVTSWSMVTSSGLRFL